MVATLGLMACATVQQETMYPLVDATGRTVAMVRASVVGNTPPGTAVQANIGGLNQLVTLGPRMNAGVSEGRAVIIGSDEGRPIVERITPGTGDLSPPGTPVVNSTTSEGRPVVTYVPPGEETATPARRRTPRRPAAAATPGG
ncbi:hypothetical protein [Rhodovarius lipocyclicus]|uniref:hypothetical protein n=1 Tax=Rhodovarius lipocyclicus TaxID=268410 RepID=UPI001357F394|nr:hypothetical protein [Rhodovarius lipocyclicus]